LNEDVVTKLPVNIVLPVMFAPYMLPLLLMFPLAVIAPRTSIEPVTFTIDDENTNSLPATISIRSTEP
jgi:hypothetical protein